MHTSFVAALAAATALTLSFATPATAQEHRDGEHHEGHQGGGHPAAPPPAPHTAPPAPRPAFVPQGRPVGPPQGFQPQDRGHFGGPGGPGGPGYRAQVYGQPRGYAAPPHAYEGGAPVNHAYDQGRGAPKTVYFGQQVQGDRGRPGFDNRERGDRAQGFVDSGQGGVDRHRFESDRARFEGGHDRGRDFERERHEYEREHVDFRRFGGDPDRYRHDYGYHEWRGREYDPVRLQIIDEYGYRPFGYGLGYGFNAGIGWGFDLRFGYWYGPRYYDPGYDFWYGPQSFYQYGVSPEELILRDSRLYDWALRWFDYDRDGYLERNEVVDAARAFRRFADFDGNGYIDGREYRYALERIDGFQPDGY